jgi:hypothetical protein
LTCRKLIQFSANRKGAACPFYQSGNQGWQPLVFGSAAEKVHRWQAADDNTLPACARRSCALLARGSDELRFGARGFEAKNCLAFLHQIKAITRNRFQVAYIGLEQIDLARLMRQ